MLPSGVYGICDDTLRPDLDLAAQARLLLSGGLRVLQLRAKRTSLRDWVAQARQAVLACHEQGAICLVNDRVDVALLAGADGVHLGEEDLAPEDARAVLPQGALIGVTVRNAEQAGAAARAGANYVGVGPVFATTTKSVAAPVLGVERLAAIAGASPLPLVAIGGISLERIASVARSGVRCAAVASDLLGAVDVPARARALEAAFLRGARGEAS